jgi:hypothetical protein
MEKCVDINYAYKFQGYNAVFNKLAEKIFIMHQLHIVHLDIKISNLMLDQKG